MGLVNVGMTTQLSAQARSGTLFLLTYNRLTSVVNPFSCPFGQVTGGATGGINLWAYLQSNGARAF